MKLFSNLRERLKKLSRIGENIESINENVESICASFYGADEIRRVEMDCGGWIVIPVSDVAESMEEFRHDPELTHINARALLHDGS